MKEQKELPRLADKVADDAMRFAESLVRETNRHALIDPDLVRLCTAEYVGGLMRYWSLRCHEKDPVFQEFAE